jgi:polyisoprenoid-binding protein YceI
MSLINNRLRKGDLIMKMKWMFGFILALSTASFAWAAQPPPPGTYDIDPAHSKVGFEISHLVISTVDGRFNEYSGNIVVGKTEADSSVNALIKMASIDTGMAKRDNHLRDTDFFNVQKYPEMTFKSKKLILKDSDLTIVGDLTLHGVTREVTLNGKYLGFIKGMGGEDRIAGQASTTINRGDFGLTWNKMIEAGPVVGDEVTILLKVEAVRK